MMRGPYLREDELQTITWANAPARSRGPLSGVRVLDLSAWAVGPWAAVLLAAMGADVVKIDPPYGDPIRQVRPAHLGRADNLYRVQPRQAQPRA